jgi:hypothetical protein
VQYDLIVDNPWEHPEELKDTLRLVAALKPPYTFAINALTLLPGTTIYDMGEQAGFTKKDEKITLASYVTYMATELNLTLAFYNIAPVPKFWLNRVLKRDYGERTVTMKQYPRLGALISGLGIIKKICHGLLRGDISAIPRPFDLIAGRIMRLGKTQKPAGARLSREFEHSLPTAPPQRQRAFAQAAGSGNGSELKVLR